MAEWFMAPVLKTGGVNAPGGSNPSTSSMIKAQVQGVFDYPTPAPSQSCRPTRERFYVVLTAAAPEPSVPMLNLRIPLAEFDQIEPARACADAINSAIQSGRKPEPFI